MNGYGDHGMSLRVEVTPMVRKIMLANVWIYLASVVAVTINPSGVSTWLAENLLLEPASVLETMHVWTLGTYAWLHELGTHPLLALVVCAGVTVGFIYLYRTPFARREHTVFWILALVAMMAIGATRFGAPLHLAGNLIGLYFFGHLFERRWGAKRFLTFWVVCTVAGGAAEFLMNFAWDRNVLVLGASGGVLGLIGAFAVYYPEEQVLYGLVVPIKGKYFVLIALAFDVLSLITGANVAVFAHIGGMIAGLLMTSGYWRPTKIRTRFGGGGKPRKRPSHLRIVPPSDDDDEPPQYIH
jgi:membrane associated rhomboid family serine protease